MDYADPPAQGPESAAVLVILGDNDFAQSEPGPEFESPYLEFVKKIREKNPSCPVLLCTSSFIQGGGPKKKVGEAIDSVIATMKSARIIRFNLAAYQENWGYGADWHISRGWYKKVTDPLIGRLEGRRKGRVRPDQIGQIMWQLSSVLEITRAPAHFAVKSWIISTR